MVELYTGIIVIQFLFILYLLYLRHVDKKKYEGLKRRLHSFMHSIEENESEKKKKMKYTRLPYQFKPQKKAM